MTAELLLGGRGSPRSALAIAWRLSAYTLGREHGGIAQWVSNRPLARCDGFMGHEATVPGSVRSDSGRPRACTSSGKAMFQMMGVFAEFERAMIQERVRAGIARARSGQTLGAAADTRKGGRRHTGRAGQAWPPRCSQDRRAVRRQSIDCAADQPQPFRRGRKRRGRKRGRIARRGRQAAAN
jgi:Resolvase, N terminal domain